MHYEQSWSDWTKVESYIRSYYTSDAASFVIDRAVRIWRNDYKYNDNI
jgi:hypothetical protein